MKMTINKIPAATWSWLKMNGASVLVDGAPENFSPSLSSSGGVEVGACDFSALPAIASVETAAGREADALFEKTRATVIRAPRGTAAAEPVSIDCRLADGIRASSAQIIRAEEGSSVTVVVARSSAEGARGFFADRTICEAGKNSRVHVVKISMLGSEMSLVDDISVVCAEGACARVTRIFLGGGSVHSAVAASLEGVGSSFKSDMAYLLDGTSSLDINDVARHTAPRAKCEMSVKGALRGRSSKTYRGTIDFRRGCSGSTGNEQEEALLLSSEAVNKSIPIILCGEEDVSGEHGASIGALGAETLFYMNARGISAEAAESMMARAKVESVSSLIPDESARARISAWLDEVA